MSLLPTIGAVDQDTGFYNGVATQSLRFAYTTAETWLAKTPDAGNRKTHTLSVWIKRSGLSASQNILEARGSGDAGNVDIWFDANDRLEVSGGSTYWRTTTRVFRDVSSWYHIMIVTDTVQTGQTFSGQNALRIYVNGVEETVFTDNNHYSEDTDYAIGGNVEHRIGDGYGHFDGYMARYEFVDGIALTPASFGETKNGVWIAKKYTGSYGTNGHKLEFKETGTNADSSGLGADTSGNGNHYTPTEITAIDSNMPDSPENNFCVTSPTAMGGSSADQPSHSEGNLKITGTTTAWRHTRGTHAFRNGKWYFEGRVTATSGTQGYAIGICDPALPTNDNINSGTPPHKFYGRQHITKYNNDSGTASAFPATTAGTIIALAIDMDNGKMWTSTDGTWYNNNNASTTLDPDNPDWTGITVGTSGDYVTNQVVYNTSSSIVLNYGQDSSFLGDETATSNADANGNGTFHSAVPSGFLALCTANLPEPIIGPNSDTQATDHFNTLTYNGNDDATRTFDIGFVSDWAWFKADADGYGHQLYDSSRGVHKYLQSNVAGTEQTSTEGVTSFDTSGNLVIGTNAFLNEAGTDGTIWNWKANGDTTTTNDASSTGIGDRDSVYQANTTAGFSIVTYTGSGQTGAGNDDTYAHGLQVNGVATTPEVIICKNRQTTDDWLIGITAIPSFNWANDYMHWNEPEEHQTNANRSAFSVAPTSTVFSVGEFLNKTNNYVAYLFASVEGYSKIGTYKGNSAASGTFVHLGFRPAWVMIKAVSGVTGQYWCIFDNKRDPFNDQASQVLYVNASDAEGTGGIDIDFLSNGMKMRDAGNNHNSSSGVYIYMAFAEAPFKYANAR